MAEPLIEILDLVHGVRVSWSGRRHPPTSALVPGVSTLVGTLRLRPLAEQALTACVYSSEGVKHDAVGVAGPPMFEETAYRLTVEGPLGSTVSVSQRNPSIVQEVERVGTSTHIVSGTVNFRRQIGYAEFVVSLNDAAIFAFTLEVYPYKVDYAADYLQMRSEVDSAVRGLAFEYLRATYADAGVTTLPQRWNLEWLAILASEAQSIRRAIQHIERYPHRQLRREVRNKRIERIRRTNSIVRSAVRHGKGTGPRESLPSGAQIRSRLPTQEAVDSLDTPEHRWLKFHLLAICRRLRVLRTELLHQSTQLKQARRSTSLIDAQVSEVGHLLDVFVSLTRESVLRGAIPLGGVPPAASLTLSQGTGYREAYQSIIRLNRSLGLASDHTRISFKDVDELYQVWCFLSLMDTVRQVLGVPVNAGTLLEVGETGLRVSIRSGRRRTLRVELHDGTVVQLSAEPSFPGPTGTQTPDIVLGIQQANWPELIVVFDAKYRVDASDRYAESFGTPGPPVDAVNALHRYRDAIYVTSEQQVQTRPVIRGAALFPFPGPEEEFRQNRLFSSIEQLGIGALPYLPSSRVMVEEWLEVLLTESVDSLAEPGLPFAGLEAKMSVHRRA